MTYTFEEYRKLTERTLASLDHHTSNYRLLDNLHLVIGMMTEIAEIIQGDREGKGNVNLQEEIGDLCWYLANYLNINNIGTTIHTDVDHLLGYPIDDDKMYSLFISVSDLLDAHKKELAYGERKTITDIQRRKFVLNIYLAINNLALDYGIDFNRCLYKNIEKLKVRYPEKFSEENAVDRDLDKENNVLKK